MKNNDYGGQAIALNIDKLAKANPYFRTALWTGDYLQVTLMSIPRGSDIGTEMHEGLDQFLKIEEGSALLLMGKEKTHLCYHKLLNKGFVVFVPAGTWHNIINTGKTPLKIYSVYAPPQHPFGTVHKTKADAEHH